MTKKTVGPDIGAAAAMPRGGRIGSADLCSCRFVGEKRQRRFFDEHGLDDGLSRPGRKIRPGDTLTKQRWFRHWGSGSPRDSVGRFGSADLCGCRFVGENRQRRFFDEHGLDDGLSRPGRKIRPGDTLTKAGSSGKIGFFDEHGLDAGLAGPGRKIRQGETLPKAGSSGKIGADLEKFWKN